MVPKIKTHSRVHSSALIKLPFLFIVAGSTPFKLGIIKYKKNCTNFWLSFHSLKTYTRWRFRTSSHIYFYKGVHASFSLVILEINYCSNLLNLQSVHAPNGLIAHLFGLIDSGTQAWCIYAWRKWSKSHSTEVSKARWGTIHYIWRPCIWYYKKYPSTF